jgi:hypothetical protein
MLRTSCSTKGELRTEGFPEVFNQPTDHLCPWGSDKPSDPSQRPAEGARIAPPSQGCV